MRLYIFDDRVADGWHPFALTRPCGELRFGTMLLRERLEGYAGVPATATLSRDWLASFQEEGAPPAMRRDTRLAEGAHLLLSSRAVPAHGARFPEDLAEPATLRMRDETVGCFLPPGHASPGADWLLDPKALAGSRDVEVDGSLLRAVWELVERNPDRLAADLASCVEKSSGLPNRVHRIGDGVVLLGRDVELEPGILLDTREGGIRLDAGVEVRTGARLQGPLHVGPGSRLLGGSFSALAAGPMSYLRGEIEASVVLGYANKAHDGFLGHAYLGRWVNLGALTTNSDLKNNYGSVRIGGPEGDVDTGLLKFGCLLGDHVRTAIGTLLNTGTVVGAGSSLFGPDMPPKWVRPFSWGSALEAPAFDRDRFLDTAARVMARRGLELGDPGREWLSACWEAGRGRGGSA